MFKHCLHVLLAATGAALLTSTFAQPAQAEDWQYRADLGGWLDVDTGLVWGPYSQEWTGYWYTWAAAKIAGTASYQQLTGNPKWRLPTLEETQVASGHHATTYFAQTSTSYYNTCGWTSTAGTGKNKKDAWVMQNLSTNYTRLISQQSAVGFRVVYRP